MLRRLSHAIASSLLLLFACLPAHADMTIEIVGGGANRHVIALPAFAAEAGVSGGITPIVRNDLARSGAFKVLEPNAAANAPTSPAEIDYPAWQGAGAMSVAVGRVSVNGGQLSVEFHLMDAAQKRRLTGGVLTVPLSESRAVAHRIADMIYQAITGERGVFSTQIAYVLRTGRIYQLQVADADGAGAQTLLRSAEPIISPAWSPDGGRLADVSFESKKPVVYVHALASGARQAVAAFKGSNSAPAWSADGGRLAVVLTRDGASQIYSVPVSGGEPVRLSQSAGIDTEPDYAPDGSRILFTSDRAGSPQIYSMSASGGGASRVTFEGNYNVSPNFAPDGKSFTFIRREGGRYRVMLHDFTTGQANALTDTSHDESPSFAPNGKMILYASEQGGRGVLYTVSRDGQTKTRLTTPGGDVQEPAWGPFPR